MPTSSVALTACALLLAGSLAAQPPASLPREVAGIPVNYDEAKTGPYQLPELLKLASGKPVPNAKTWSARRRAEVYRLLEENQFGKVPGRPSALSFDVCDKGTPALDGKALRRQITVSFTDNPAAPKMDVLLYLPAAATKPVPVLLQISFVPNSLVVDDAGIKPGMIWNKEQQRVPAPQKSAMPKLNILPFLEKGYGFATVYYGDIEPDFAGGLKHGVRALYLKPGQTEPAADEWGAIAAWGWGLSRAIDYLETDKSVDARRIAIFGVSRLGKTVLWAGARDTRVALVIASCSGEAGAALSKRNYGETVKHMTARFGYQFSANYQKWGDRVSEMPFDAHMLLALVAPRPLLLQTGDQDYWSDPKGEFLAAVAAGPVYRLLGQQALDTDALPAVGTPILHTLGYFEHSGGHGPIATDYAQFLAYLEKFLKPRP